MIAKGKRAQHVLCLLAGCLMLALAGWLSTQSADRALAAGAGWRELLRAHGAVTGLAVAPNGRILLAAAHDLEAASGYLLRSSDGGATWARVGPSNLANLYAVTFTDAFTLIVVGDNGTVLASTDTGLNWGMRATRTNLSLRGVFFANSQHGWVTGQHGTLLQTSDAGLNWNAVSGLGGFAADLEGIHGSDLSHVAAVGTGGALVYTHDGVNWQPAATATQVNLHSVFLRNGQAGAGSLHPGHLGRTGCAC